MQIVYLKIKRKVLIKINIKFLLYITLFKYFVIILL